MEIPRYWRDMPVNTSFSGKLIGTTEERTTFFKFPGGEILLTGTLEQIYERFENSGFKPEVIEKILLCLFGRVTTKTTIS